MSNSYKKTPVSGWTTAKSEKEDKRIWHKRMRSHTRDLCQKCETLDEEELEGMIFPVEHDVSDNWDMAKDGKVYHGAYKEGDGFHTWKGEWQDWWENKFEYFKQILRK